MAEYKLIIDGAVMERLMHSPEGLIGRWLYGQAQRVQDAARVDCPKRTGKLSQSIVKRPVITSELGMSVIIGAYQPYAVFVHEGTKAHVIMPKTAKALHWVNGAGDDVFAKSVHHPGTKPHRFLTDNMKLMFI